MAQNKEQLDKLLDFIAELIKQPGNEEFTEKLRTMLGSDKKDSSRYSFMLIEKYLGLDFKLDSRDSIIDYSFVENEQIRSQLESDNREMMRYRFGVRSHAVDFKEFCRYASLQVEMLLFLYYTLCFNSLGDVKDFLVEKYPDANVKSAKSVEDISQWVKLVVIKNAGFISYTDHQNLDWVREIRNEQSHRSSKSEEMSFLLNMEEQLKPFPRWNTGEIDFAKLKENTVLYNIYNTKIKKRDYNKYLFLLWKEKQPFSDIIKSLHNLAQFVKKEVEQL